MSEPVRILYYALWIAHPLLQAGIAAAMLRLKLHRKFKFFFAYLCSQILSFVLIFAAYKHSYTIAFYLSWITSASSAFLGFTVVHEAFLDVFRPFDTLRDLGTVLFKWAGLVMLLVAGVVSVSTNSADLAPWMQAILTSQRCVRIIQVGMVLFLLFFSRYLGVSRRQYSFGIALGFGGFAVVELALIASWVGDHLGNPWMSLVNMAAYNLTLLTWLGYTLVKSPAREVSATLLQSQRWEQSLTDIHHPLPENSLIPMFEGMVDRALSRSHAASTAALENAAPAVEAAPAVRRAAAAVGGLHLPSVAERLGSKS
jgi:hypothetical protein